MSDVKQPVDDPFAMTIQCSHCAGLGLDPDKGKRRRRGKSVTWTFNVQEDACPVCKGTGQVQS